MLAPLILLLDAHIIGQNLEIIQRQKTCTCMTIFKTIDKF